MMLTTCLRVKHRWMKVAIQTTSSLSHQWIQPVECDSFWSLMVKRLGWLQIPRDPRRLFRRVQTVSRTLFLVSPLRGKSAIPVRCWGWRRCCCHGGKVVWRLLVRWTWPGRDVWKTPLQGGTKPGCDQHWSCIGSLAGKWSCAVHSKRRKYWHEAPDRQVGVSNFSMTRNSILELYTLDRFRHVGALPENRLRRRHVLSVSDNWRFDEFRPNFFTTTLIRFPWSIVISVGNRFSFMPITLFQ